MQRKPTKQDKILKSICNLKNILRAQYRENPE